MGTNHFLKAGLTAFAACLCAFALRAAEIEEPNPAGPEKPEPPPAVEQDAEVVELPGEKPRAPKPKPEQSIDIGLDEDVLKAAKSARAKDDPPAAKPGKAAAPKPLEPSKIELQTKPKPDTQIVLSQKSSEPGFASVLTGTLQNNTEIGPEIMPHLIRGILVVPAKVTLKINAGATVHLRGDSSAAKPAASGSPDPSKSAVVWVYGTLIVAGETGKPVEITGIDKDANANLLLYGNEQSKFEGARFKAADVAQSGGVCQWTNCEFNDSKYYALAAGAGLFTHCAFKKCGGIFAAYDEGPWALLARKCLFENCRDGLLLNRDPGPACLIVEKNNFTGTRGANLRAMPRAGIANAKNAEELLIGENWYGTNVEEEVDRRIVDNRSDKTIKAHLNIRPPAVKPYANTGAGLAQNTIVAALNEQQSVSVKLLQALATKQKGALEKSKVAMEKERGKTGFQTVQQSRKD